MVQVAYVRGIFPPRISCNTSWLHDMCNVHCAMIFLNPPAIHNRFVAAMTFIETFGGKGFVGTEFLSIFNESEICEMHNTIFDDVVCGVVCAIF